MSIPWLLFTNWIKQQTWIKQHCPKIQETTYDLTYVSLLLMHSWCFNLSLTNFMKTAFHPFKGHNSRKVVCDKVLQESVYRMKSDWFFCEKDKALCSCLLFWKSYSQCGLNSPLSSSINGSNSYEPDVDTARRGNEWNDSKPESSGTTACSFSQENNLGKE